MKNIAIFTAAAMLALASCTKDAIREPNPSKPTNPELPTGKTATVTATAEQHSDNTRTSLAEGKVLWTEGDKMVVTLESDFKITEAVYTLTEGAGTPQGTFEGAEMPEGPKLAFYPNGFLQYDGDLGVFVGNISLPQTQQYLTGSFGNGANPMIARSDTGNNFAFKNLCGALRLQLTGEATISRIQIIAADDALSGLHRATMDDSGIPMLEVEKDGQVFNRVMLTEINQALDPTTPTGFTIVLPPRTYAAGLMFVIETSTGELMYQTTKKEITIERSKITPLKPFEANITTKNFPDANFREYLATQGFILSNKGTAEEDIDINNESNKAKLEGPEAITEIICSNMNIMSFKGIEHFKELSGLECYYNLFTEFDLTNLTKLTYLYCSGNPLARLDLTNQTQLTHLTCSSNQLAELNLTSQTQLTQLVCDNNQLTTLNLTNQTLLTDLDCQDNQLTGLNLTSQAQLALLNCNNNQLTTLDLTNQTLLTKLECSKNQLTELDLTSQTGLIELGCKDNLIAELNLTNQTLLTTLDCNNNRIAALSLPGVSQLKYMICSDNPLMALDLTNQAQLLSLDCKNNQLATLDLTNQTLLNRLSCTNNQLAELDLTNQAQLVDLSCNNNQLTELDLTNQTLLNWLSCTNNQLTKLDITRQTVLAWLFCSKNKLTEFDLTSQTKLTELECHSNQLTMLNLRNHNRHIFDLVIGNQADANGRPLTMVAYVSSNIGAHAFTTDDPLNVRASLDWDSPVPTSAPAAR